MSSQRLVLAAAGGVALLVLIAFAVYALLPSGSSSAEGGLVIVDGRRLDPPFEVTRDGADVRVNGVLAQSLGVPVNTSSPGAAAASDDVFAIVEQAARVSSDAGDGDAGLDAALAFLQAHPAAPQVARLDDPLRIEVTDADGVTAALQYEVPDQEGRPIEPDQGEELAGRVADRWRAHLAEGGGIVASSTGVALLVPASEVAAFEASLASALALSGSAKDAALTALLTAPALIEEQGGTPPSLEDYATAARMDRASDGTHPIAAVTGPDLDADAPGHLAAGAAKTPGKRQGFAMIFTALGGHDAEPYFDAIQAEGYEALVYYNPKTIGAFAATSRSGALYNVTHSSPNSLSVAHFTDDIEAARYHASLREGRVDGGLYRWWRQAGEAAAWWLSLTPAGIRHYWSSNDTIVHSASCEGIALAAAFGAREFFGYDVTTTGNIARGDSEKLWQRWSGKDGQGAFRSATLAWGQGGFSAGFRYTDGSPDGDTVLSPEVTAARLPDIHVGGEAAILVGFDAIMKTSERPNEVVTITGCAVVEVDAQWQFDSIITTQVTAEEPGEYTVTVNQAKAKSPADIFLDGNQNPETSGVVPNRDDYVARGRCLAADATPTPMTDPRTPTPTATDATPTSTPAGPTVEVDVLVLDGEHFPVEQFISAPADACDAAHYHAHQPVRSLEGTEIATDPNPGTCGFGKVAEVPARTVQWPESEVQAWQEWSQGN